MNNELTTETILRADIDAGQEPFGPIAPKFKVGQPVLFIGNWDRKGTAFVQPCFIKASGKKLIHLLDSSGAPIEQRIYTEKLGNPLYPYRLYPHTGDMRSALAIGLAVSSQLIAKEHEHYQRCLGLDANVNYLSAIRKNLAEVLTIPAVRMLI
jgi:hypothetical protein